MASSTRSISYWEPFVLIVLVFAASCSRDPYEAMVKNLPRRFLASGKGYILDEKRPGLIDDDAAVYTADGGARTFDFNARTVLTHSYVGKRALFATLSADEVRELRDVANGALAYIRKLEKRQNRLSEVDRLHRELLTEFLENKPLKKKVLSSESNKRFIAVSSELQADYCIYRYRTPGSNDLEEITLLGDFRSAKVTSDTFDSNATPNAEAKLIEIGLKFEKDGKKIGRRGVLAFTTYQSVRIFWTDGDVFWDVQAPSLELAREFEQSEIVRSITASQKEKRRTATK
ncbi:MAG TPA: hypothetical protein VMC85_07865 [Desulfomonilaceae bacterium]|nr:hypothetical protein [Desulfomonilaceae bacterium]